MSRYAEVHANFWGAGDGRPTAQQIIDDEGLRGRLVGKVVVITGATSGIGLETARALATTGATLFLTTRNIAGGEAACRKFLEPGRVSLVHMDHLSLKSVQYAASEILSRSKTVNILIENAGVMGLPQKTTTEDGFEAHFQTNVLSHFLLFSLLKDALLSSSTPSFHSRLVVVASSASKIGHLPPRGDYNFEKTEYNSHIAYAITNLEKIYFAAEVHRRYSSQGLVATSLHPGAIGTNLGRHSDPAFFKELFAREEIVKTFKSPPQGAATTVVAAVGKQWENRGGLYLEDCDEAKPGSDDGDMFTPGLVEHTYHAENEARLWKDLCGMLDLRDEA